MKLKIMANNTTIVSITKKIDEIFPVDNKTVGINCEGIKVFIELTDTELKQIAEVNQTYRK